MCTQVTIHKKIKKNLVLVPRSAKNSLNINKMNDPNASNVKQALYEELQNILSPNKEIRIAAEGRIQQLEFTEGKFELSSDLINFYLIIVFLL